MGLVDIFNLPKNTFVSSLSGQKILIYGDNDTGKTYQACRLPKPLLLMAESGGNALNVPKVALNDWDTFLSVVKQLTSSKTKEDALKEYQTVIIDTVEELVYLNEDKVSKRFGVLEVGMVQKENKDNPNGYSLARNMFRHQINLLTNCGYCVVFISHNQTVEKINSLTGEVYEQQVPYNSENKKSSSYFIRSLCDFVIYTKSNGIDPETKKTVFSTAQCKETEHAFARSRYDIDTFISEFTAENLEKAISEAIKRTAENENANLISKREVLNNLNLTKEDYFELIKPYMLALSGKGYKEFVKEIIDNNLGEGRKLTSAEDDEVNELSTIYNDLMSFCDEKSIEV